MSDKTLMEYDSSSTSYEDEIEEEYEEAKINGFSGTIDEYKMLRDYT